MFNSRAWAKLMDSPRSASSARIAATTVTDKDAGAVDHAFSIVAARSFDQDPRYGLIVLGEIADKALSAAVNDVGTVVAGTVEGGAGEGQRKDRGGQQGETLHGSGFRRGLS